MSRRTWAVASLAISLSACGIQSKDELPAPGRWLHEGTAFKQPFEDYLNITNDDMFRLFLFSTGESEKVTHFSRKNGKFHADEKRIGDSWPKNYRTIHGTYSRDKLVVYTDDVVPLLTTAHRTDIYTLIKAS